jgi:hypothetical protein
MPLSGRKSRVQPETVTLGDMTQDLSTEIHKVQEGAFEVMSPCISDPAEAPSLQWPE